jgi:hypothetical protein
MLALLESPRTYIVMAGLVPAIYVAPRDNSLASSVAADAYNGRMLAALGDACASKTWMAGTSPAMTPRAPHRCRVSRETGGRR